MEKQDTPPTFLRGNGMTGQNGKRGILFGSRREIITSNISTLGELFICPTCKKIPAKKDQRHSKAYIFESVL